MSNSKKAKMSTVNVASVKNKMRAGEATKIANSTGYSTSHVINVLAGRRKNNDIVAAAHKLTSRRK